jgi:uncharacterized protein (DUF1919 family)
MSLRTARQPWLSWSLGRRLRAAFPETTSFIASNCVGSRLSALARRPYRSPTVDLFLAPGDFLHFAAKLPRYLELPFRLDQDEAAKRGWPVAVLASDCLPPIRLQLQHYKTLEAGEVAWRKRAERIDWERIVLCHTDRDGATLEQLAEFDRLPYHKIVFTHLPRPQISSACYVPGFEREGQVGDLFSEWPRLSAVLTRSRLRAITAATHPSLRWRE